MFETVNVSRDVSQWLRLGISRATSSSCYVMFQRVNVSYAVATTCYLLRIIALSLLQKSPEKEAIFCKRDL